LVNQSTPQDEQSTALHKIKPTRSSPLHKELPARRFHPAAL